MDSIVLKASSRAVLGKKVRFLRRQGIIPTHLFGHGVESVAAQCDFTELKQVLAQAGRTRLIDLTLDEEEKSLKVMVREVQRDPLSGALLHVDLYQVRMGEKITLDVPIIFIGDAAALKSKENMLSHELNKITIECLPDRIPSDIKVDVSSLAEPDQAIRVRDLALGEGITILNDPDVVLARISIRPAERVEEEVVKAEAEVPEGAAPAAEEAAKPAEEA